MNIFGKHIKRCHFINPIFNEFDEFLKEYDFVNIVSLKS